jgi:hypothetical protein
MGVQIQIREFLQYHVGVDTNACSCVSQTMKWLDSSILIMKWCIIGKSQCFRAPLCPENGSSRFI